MKISVITVSFNSALTIEETMRGSHTLRLKTNENYGNLDKSFPPNNESIISIKQLIRELKYK